MVLSLATGLGAGLSPVAPGTVGALVGLALAWAVHWLTGSLVWQVVLLTVLCVLCVPVCSSAADFLGTSDPSQVVLDELAAQPFALLLVPFSGKSCVLAFLWFRLFDIWKPWPVCVAERLPKGWGIMADDIAAALLAAGTTFLSMRLGQQLGWWE